MVQTKILNALKDEDVRVYVVWTPVLQEDHRQAAIKASRHVSDERATHFWDADKSLGFLLGKIVTLPRQRDLAWDVYFVFDQGSAWYDAPPRPANWMHQLANDQRTLDADALRDVIERLLKQND